LWVVRSVMNNLVFFHYDKGSRAQKVVIELLQKYTGTVQTDGYEALCAISHKTTYVQNIIMLNSWIQLKVILD